MDDVRLHGDRLCWYHADKGIEVATEPMKEVVEVVTNGVHPRSVHVAEDETLSFYVDRLIARANCYILSLGSS